MSDADQDGEPPAAPAPTDAVEPASDAETADEPSREALEDRIETLEAENERLRRRYARSQRTSYRRTAFGLAALGLAGLAGAAAFPDLRTVLVTLGAIGLFGAVLTYYLTPERFVTADVAERVYDSLARNEADLVADLGLSDARVYVPYEDASRLFVPARDDAPLPDADALDAPLVVTDETRGLALAPAGAGLFTEFERTLTGSLADSPAALAAQLTDALVEAFELVDRTDAECDAADGRLTVAVHGSAYGSGFDTPPASFLATGLAVGLDRPVRVEVTTADRGDFAVTCRWEPAETSEE